ncbi:hypothetical protein AY606_11510 [Acinetobacter sp. SFB]|nr:hypothetical protein AY606_11510 [Acinetobacter sp. SFB]
MSAPKLFISYSWTSTEHEDWVLRLAHDLTESGVDVKFDKWDLKEGQDPYYFMEQMVADETIAKVIMICDQKYKSRADDREKGVGIETQIISSKIYNEVKQTKFVAVIAEVDDNGNPFIPVYYSGRIHIDLSNDDKYTQNFEQLIRWVFDKPLHQRPQLGKPPQYILEEKVSLLGIDALARRCIDLLKRGKPNAQGAINEYFDTLLENLNRFKLEYSDDLEPVDHATLIFNRIEEFKQPLEQIIRVLYTIASHAATEDSMLTLHRFFEGMSQYFYPDSNGKTSYSYREWDFDFYKFIAHELFLYTLAIFIKMEKFSIISFLLNHPYYCYRGSSRSKKIKQFDFLNEDIESLKFYFSEVEGKNWYSSFAELIKRRFSIKFIGLDRLCQADFICYLNLMSKNIESSRYDYWNPTLQLYHDGHDSYEIFAKSISKKYCEKILPLLNINATSNLKELLEKLSNNPDMIPRVGEWGKLPIKRLSNYDLLLTLP